MSQCEPYRGHNGKCVDETIIYVCFLAVVLCAGMFLCINCSSSGTNEDVGPAAPDWNWSNIGPTKGYVSSVVFHPTHSGEVWASGSDSDGIYKSEDYGASWSLVTGGAPNQSTFSFIIDPARPNTFYAPSHYGRGLLKSTDGGVTWTLSQANLPSSTEAKKVYDLA